MGLRINASKTEIMAIKLKPKNGNNVEVQRDMEAEEVVIERVTGLTPASR